MNRHINKCVDVIVGMQFGSEAKGKIAALLAPQYMVSARVGAPNAGHTIFHKGAEYKMRSIPCAWVNNSCALFIGAGGMINLDVLFKEIKDINESDTMDVRKRLFIDINAGIVTHDDIVAEEQAKMYEGIGSTCEGIGEAMARKILRRNGVTASKIAELQPYIANVGQLLNEHVDRGLSILIEGTQGFGLSLNHGYYPYVTSRDVLAASMVGECGLSPHTVRHVIGVMRTYPIRVHGNSGPMGAEELSWEEVAKRSGYEELCERTTVTKRVRRVSTMNWDLVKAAAKANRPTEIALTFADYIDVADRGKTRFETLTPKALDFVYEVENKLQTPVTIVSTGPHPSETIYRYHRAKEE